MGAYHHIKQVTESGTAPADNSTSDERRSLGLCQRAYRAAANSSAARQVTGIRKSTVI